MQNNSLDTKSPTTGSFGWILARRSLMWLALIVVMLTFNVYGISWDEPIQRYYGNSVVWFWLSGLTDLRSLNTFNMALYGGAFDAFLRLMEGLFPFDPYDTRHLFNALSGLLGVVGTARLADFAAGPKSGPVAGFVATVLLLSTPSWWGHMFINPKDIPLASAGVWTLYYIARLGARMPEAPLKLCLKLGLALGLALSARVGAAVYIFYAVALLLLWFAVGGRVKFRFWAKLLLIITIAFLLMISLWPAAVLDPIGAPLAALKQTSYFAWKNKIQVSYFGEIIDARNLPWHYAPVYLAIKLPLVVLLFGISGLGLLGFRLLQGSGGRNAIFVNGAILFGAIFPVFYVVFSGSVLYDSIRHLLFVIPPLVAAASVLIAKLTQIKSSRVMVGVVVGALLIYPLTQMVRLHPYQYVFYNLAMGGTKGAAGKFDLDYWATSYRAAADALMAANTLAFPVRVKVCGPFPVVSHYLDPGYEIVNSNEEADYYFRLMSRECNEPTGKIIATVERMGVIFSTVEEIKKVAK